MPQIIMHEPKEEIDTLYFAVLMYAPIKKMISLKKNYKIWQRI